MSGSATPIVSIPIDTAQFERFYALFQKFEASVAKIPAAWASFEGHLKTQSGYLERMAQASERQGTSVRRMGEDAGAFRRTIDAVARQFEKVDHSVYNISRHIASATLDLFKWSTIFTGISGLLGAGGLFGLNRLAQASAGGLRTARGLGVTTAEAQAFSINYQRAVDPGSVLGNVAEAQAQHATWEFNALGIGNYQNRDPAQLAQDVFEHARRIYMQSDRSEEYAKAHGLLRFMTMEDLRRSGAMSDEEVAGMRRGTAADTQRFQMNASVGVGWQNFINQMERAGTVLENSFIKVLIGLESPLEKFSAELAKVVEKMEPKMAEWIGKLGSALEVFADYLGTDKFERDVKSFAAGVAAMASALARFIGWFGGGSGGGSSSAGFYGADGGIGFIGGPLGFYGLTNPVTGFTPTIAGGIDVTGGGPNGGLRGEGPNSTNPGNLKNLGGVGFQRFINSDVGVRAMRDQLLLYYDRDHLDTVASIVGKYAPSSENDTAAYVADVVRRMSADMPRISANQHLDLHDPYQMAELESAMLIHENRRQNAGYTPNVIITINNATGGSAVVSTSQLASTPKFMQ